MRRSFQELGLVGPCHACPEASSQSSASVFCEACPACALRVVGHVCEHAPGVRGAAASAQGCLSNVEEIKVTIFETDLSAKMIPIPKWHQNPSQTHKIRCPKNVHRKTLFFALLLDFWSQKSLQNRYLFRLGNFVKNLVFL